MNRIPQSAIGFEFYQIDLSAHKQVMNTKLVRTVGLITLYSAMLMQVVPLFAITYGV